MSLIDESLASYGFCIGTPREAKRRGGHVALEHDEAIRVNAALKARGIIADFRFPNVIRLAPIALVHVVSRYMEGRPESPRNNGKQRIRKIWEGTRCSGVGMISSGMIIIDKHISDGSHPNRENPFKQTLSNEIPQVWAVAWPLILTNMLNVLVGIIDFKDGGRTWRSIDCGRGNGTAGDDVFNGPDAGHQRRQFCVDRSGLREPATDNW